MSRNQKVLALVLVIFLALILISWFFKNWGFVGAGIGGFIFGYFLGKKNT